MSAWRTLGVLAMLAHQADPPGAQDAALTEAACGATINGMGLSAPPTLAEAGRLIRFDCDRFPASGELLHLLVEVAKRDGLVPLPASGFHQQAVLFTGAGFTSRFWLFRFKGGTPARTLTLSVDQFGQMDEAEDVPDAPLLEY